MLLRTTKVICTKCKLRIPKHHPILKCDLCHLKCFKCHGISKKVANDILRDSTISWTCRQCIQSTLPCYDLNNTLATPNRKIPCSACTGFISGVSNAYTCSHCDQYVHRKCFRFSLGCIKCCTDNIPGYNCSTHELSGDLTPLNKLQTFNPYCNDHIQNCIGEAGLDNNDEIWTEISDLLVSCKYQYLANVHSPAVNELNILSLNVRSLTKLMDRLNNEPLNLDVFDILCFSETGCSLEKLPNGISDIALTNFHDPLLRSPSRISGRGGGLAIYVNKRVCDDSSLEIYDPDLGKIVGALEFEYLILKIHKCKGHSQTQIISNIYRSPSKRPTKFIEQFSSFLNRLNTRHGKKNIHISGDFNINLIKYDTNSAAKDLIDRTSEAGFLQTVSRPTRITSHSATLIDHVYTNRLEQILSCNVLTIDVSDHLGTVTIVSLGNRDTAKRPKRLSTPENLHIRSFTMASELKFVELIALEDWDGVYSSDLNASQKCQAFINTYMKHYNDAFPIKSSLNRRKNERKCPKPWILPWLEDACARKQRLFFEWKSSGCDSKSAAYEKLSEFCKKHINLAKSKYYKKYFADHISNSRKQWQMINQLLGRNRKKSGQIRVESENGEIISTPKAVANKFIEYFSNVAPNLKKKITEQADTSHSPIDTLGEATSHKFEFDEIYDADVEDIIRKLADKSTLDCKISALKAVSSNGSKINVVISDLVNASLDEGIYPDCLKHAKVVPIHKGGSKLTVSNYRPISLLSTFSKVFEKVVHKQVLTYLDSNKLLCDTQYGFRPGRSCEQALLAAQREVLNCLSKKQTVILLMIDFSKAFDVLDHPKLLHKLNHYGIHGTALEWFRTYLADRYQYVSISGQNSERSSIQYGVPQGSILGPLLFVIYINDMPNINSLVKFFLYADDSNILITADSEAEAYTKLNDLSASLIKWVDTNGLFLNLKKTNYLLFSRSRKIDYQDVHIRGTKIERKTEARFLGVIIDDKLTWSKHISAVRTKMSRYLGILCKIKYMIPLNARLQIYHSFIQSHINYCSLVWGFAKRSHIESIFTMQKKGIRAVMPGFVNYFYRDGELPSHTKTAFKDLKVLTIHGIITKNALLLMHKVKYFKELLPISINQCIDLESPVINDDIEAHSRWYSEVNTEHFRKSVFLKGPLMYSQSKIKDISASCNSIKRFLKSSLLDQQSSGENEQWPTFQLYSINGIRRSSRTDSSATEVN